MLSRADSWDAMLCQKYLRFGVPTAFRSPLRATSVTLLVVDMTKGVETGDGFAHVSTVTPVAAVQIADIYALNMTPGDLVGVTITLNNSEWRIKSFAEKPGVGQSEIYLMLELA